MSAPLVSWKRQPPGSPEEAAAAELLQRVGEAPTLSREATARIRSGVQGGGKTGRRPRRRRRFPLFFEPRISVVAAGLAALAILAALIALILGAQPRVDRLTPKAPPSTSLSPH